MVLVYPPGVGDAPGASGKLRPGGATGDQILYQIIDRKNKASAEIFGILKHIAI
jgi:hypothetical protein